jgi:hypothetical protein
MNSVNDSLVVGVLLFLVFGAVSFYLYSRITQSEKRVSLLENLLLDLKISTEASFAGPEFLGPDSVEPVSGPAPLDSTDVDGTMEDEQYYQSMLRDLPIPGSAAAPAAAARTPSPVPAAAKSVSVAAAVEEEDDEAALMEAARNAVSTFTSAKMENNYESMSVKELQSAVKQRGISPIPRVRKELIDVLKRHDSGESTQPQQSSSMSLDSFLPSSTKEGGEGKKEFPLSLESDNSALMEEQFPELTEME